MRPVLLCTAALAALSTAAGAHAQAAAPVTVASVSELVITANRSPQQADRVGQAVTVLDEETIAASQAVVVTDLLAQTPGVSFSRNGGAGGTTALRIRGAEADQTVAVIDGVKLNDPASTGGGYNFANLLIGDIARIEVLRGAQSTLWGSQAIGGVVNVVTATPSQPFEGSLQVEGGSRDTAYVRGAVGGTSRFLDWRLAAGHFTTDGVSAYRLGKEGDGYRNTGLSGRALIKPIDALQIDLRAVYSKGRNEFDGFPAPAFSFADTEEYARTEDLIAYAGLNFDLLGGALKNRIGYSYTRTDRDQFNPAQRITTRTFDALGENERWEYQGVWAIADGWNATFGAETEQATMRSASPSELTPRPTPIRGEAGTDSLYAQVQGEVLPGLTLTGGVRHDDHDTFGGHTLGQVDAAWSLNDGATVLRASFGQGFKAPTLYQLYSIYGNTALAPEEAESWDVGVQHRFVDRFEVSATWFHRETENQIDFISCTGTTTNPLCFVGGVRRSGAYGNTARAKAEGAELEGRGDLGRLQIRANYTYTKAQNDVVGSANYGKLLARRPEHQANIWATVNWTGGLSTTAAVRYVGRAFDNATNTAILQPYTLLDLRASYPVNERVEVYGRIENVFDDDYETTRNYGSPGRAAYAGVRARF